MRKDLLEDSSGIIFQYFLSWSEKGQENTLEKLILGTCISPQGQAFCNYHMWSICVCFTVCCTVCDQFVSVLQSVVQSVINLCLFYSLLYSLWSICVCFTVCDQFVSVLQSVVQSVINLCLFYSLLYSLWSICVCYEVTVQSALKFCNWRGFSVVNRLRYERPENLYTIPSRGNTCWPIAHLWCRN